MEKLKVSVQTGNWFDNLFGGEKGADAAFAFIKNCGFDALDLNIDHALSPTRIKNGEPSEFSDLPTDQMLEYYRPVKEASEKYGISIVMAHAIFPLKSYDHPEFDEYLYKLVVKQMAVCRYLGIPALVVHPIAHAIRSEEWELNMKLYQRLILFLFDRTIKSFKNE